MKLNILLLLLLALVLWAGNGLLEAARAQGNQYHAAFTLGIVWGIVFTLVCAVLYIRTRRGA